MFLGLILDAAYRLTVPDSACNSDLDGDDDEILTCFDVSAVVGKLSDFNGSGLLNFFDMSAPMKAFAAGCP